MKPLIIALIFAVSSLQLFAQKKITLIDKQQIIEYAVAELDQSITDPKGVLNKSISPYKLVPGTYIFDVTIRGKGETATVFVVNDGENDIKTQNYLQDLLKAYRYNFKMKKGKLYKFQYTIML